MEEHGEQPGARPVAGPQVVCRLWREDLGPLPALLHGALLARALPEVLVLPGPAGRPRPQLLQQGGHDPLPERLHQVRGRRQGGRGRVPVRGTPAFMSVSLQAVWTQRRLQRLQPVHPSQRDGDEGAGKRLPPEGVCECECVCGGGQTPDW